MLALPCSTGNTGIRAKKIFPKEKCVLKGETKSAAEQKGRGRQRQTLKQARDNVATAQVDNDEMPSNPKTEEVRKSRSVSREKKNDGTVHDASRTMPSRRRSVEESPQTESKPGGKFHTNNKKHGPKVSQWKDKDDFVNTKRHQQKLNDSECTVPIDNKKDKSNGFSDKKKKTKARGRKSKCESDDESMRGVGCNTRIHGKTGNGKYKSKSKKKINPRPRSNSKSRTKKSESSAVRLRSSSTPPAKSKKSTTGKVLDVQSKSDSDDEEQSVYDSDCNTEFFYESTEDEWSSDEEDLPMVGTSVMKAVEDLNNKSIGFKVKNMLGISK
jgi:hypothetical protein